MQETWQHIELWLESHFPHGLANLGAPAAAPDIGRLEQTLTIALPADLKELLQTHNGEAPEEVWLLGNWSLLSAEYIEKQWAQQCNISEGQEDCLETDGYVKGASWNKGWIPFAYDGSGGYLCIDTDPASDGTIGQVIQTSSDGFAKKLSNDIHSFFQSFLKALSSNSLTVVEDCLEAEEQWWLEK